MVTDLEPQAVLERMQDQIEEFKIPRRCVVLDALPLSRNGKVDRKELTALLEERARPSSVGKG